MRLSLLLILISSIVLYAEEEDILEAAIQPQILDTLERIKKLRTETSSSIQSFHDNTGFTMLESSMEHSTGTVHVNNMNKLLNFWLSDPKFNLVDSKDTIMRSMEEYLILEKTEEYRERKFQISFNNGFGKVLFLQIDIVPFEDKIKFNKMILIADYVPARRFIVERKSKCNIFRCKSKDSIVYLPATTTSEHINEIVNMHAGLIERSLQIAY